MYRALYLSLHESQIRKISKLSGKGREVEGIHIGIGGKKELPDSCHRGPGRGPTTARERSKVVKMKMNEREKLMVEWMRKLEKMSDEELDVIENVVSVILKDRYYQANPPE